MIILQNLLIFSLIYDAKLWIIYSLSDSCSSFTNVYLSNYKLSRAIVSQIMFIGNHSDGITSVQIGTIITAIADLISAEGDGFPSL